MQSRFTIERKKRGISQKDLFEACNISKPTWQKLEDNPLHFRIVDLEVIAKAFSCTVQELLNIIDIPISAKQAFSNQEPRLNTNDTITLLLQEEGISWREFAKLNEIQGPSNLKRNLENWHSKINSKVSKIGYKISYIKI